MNIYRYFITTDCPGFEGTAFAMLGSISDDRTEISGFCVIPNSKQAQALKTRSLRQSVFPVSIYTGGDEPARCFCAQIIENMPVKDTPDGLVMRYLTLRDVRASLTDIRSQEAPHKNLATA